MIVGEIRADDLGPGTHNVERIAAVQQRLSTQHDDAVPFLLLPVRIETRFMRVDRPASLAEAPAAQATVAKVESLRDALDAIATAEVATDRREAKRKTLKEKERAIYEGLDRGIARIQAAKLELREQLRNTSPSDRESVEALRALGDALLERAGAAAENVAKIRSSYQRTVYGGEIARLRDEVLAPIREDIVTSAAPKLELWTELRFVPAEEIRAAMAEVRAIVERLNATGLPSYAALEQARDAIYPRLRQIRARAHEVIRGARPSLEAIHEEQRLLDAALARFTQVVAAVPVAGRYEEAGRTRTQTHVNEEYRKDLAGLAGGSIGRFQVLTNQNFAASAAALTEMTRFFGEIRQALAQPLAPTALRAAQAVELATRLAAGARRADAWSRDISILPLARYKEITGHYDAIARAFAPWADLIARAAEHGGELGATAARALDEARAALAALERAVYGQRMDVWDAYDKFYDEFRRKYFAVETGATRTVDELWVRVYPDDIAVHTHEPALTAVEIEDGKDFWRELVAADADAQLRKGAWRALVKNHGARRAAWIARVLEPTVSPRAFAGGGFVAALETLDRRIDEVGPQPGAFARAPAAHLRPIHAAADAALARLDEASAVTDAQRARVRRLVQSIEIKLGALGRRHARRARFLADRAPHDEAAAALAEKIDRLAAGTARLADEARPARRVPVELTFPDVPTKPAAWTTAPHCRVLPDRFVVITVAGGMATHVVAGETIGEIKVGLDPDPANAAGETFHLDETGHLVVGDSIRWMTDFDEAERKGMAIRVPILHEEALRGFDEVLVLGVKGTTAVGGRDLLEELLDNHHYNEKGLAFLPIGTPTNNTEQQAAGYRSDDDPVRSWTVEREAPLFDAAETDRAALADGLRFARALGIRPDVVGHVEHADRRDASEALVMNEALFPGTIGAYVEEFFGAVISSDTLERLGRFFCDHVSARGWIPALRVGQQPYGVLATTAFSRYEPIAGTALPPLPEGGVFALSEAQRQARFDILLYDLLELAQSDWSRVRRTKVKHLHTPGVEDPQQHFLEMLGLHPASVDAVYRFGLNVASRHPASIQEDVELRFGHSTFGPIGFLRQFDPILRRAFELPPGSLLDEHGLVAEPFREIHALVNGDRAYSVRYLQSPKTLRGAAAGTNANAYVPQLLAATPEHLVREARHRQAASTSLLYLLLRNAMLVRLRAAALDILQVEGMLTPEARRRAGSSDEFMVRSLLSDQYLTKWSYLFGPLVDLDGRLDIDFPKGPGTLYSHVTAGGADRSMSHYLANRGDNALYSTFSGRARHDAEKAALQAHAAYVARLAQIPAARLEPLVYEHLDLCSHRLDAWRLGLANRRLAEARPGSPPEPPGLFLGAYGWVENLRPSAPRAPAEGLPPALHVDGEGTVYTDADGQGFIHAPSLGHAVTAAILRSGYLSETDEPDLENKMAVNLSSRRVRMALELLDGVQSGIDLGTLLGYRFERELHEAYAFEGVSFDDLIFAFRRAFPARSAVDPASERPEQARRLVVDGLRLIDTVRDWIERNVDAAARSRATLFEVLYDQGRFTGYPWGIVARDGGRVLPRRDDPNDARRLPGVLRAIDTLADALDALGDLALSEAVFQIVRGNFPRASAVLSALAQGKAMPRPQIVDTPRSGTTITHRVLMPLPRAGSHPGWAAIPTTARAAAEPGLNHWLGALLGDPAQIRAWVQDPAAPAAAPREVTAADLGLQPIDWLAMLGSGLEEGETELVSRIVHFVLPVPIDLHGGPRPMLDVHVADRRAGWTADQKTFFEIAPLLGGVQEMLGRARPVGANDLVVDETAVDPGSQPAVDWDQVEVAARVDDALARLRAVGVELMTALNGGAAPAEDIAAVDPKAWAEAHQAVFDDAPAIVAALAPLAAASLRAAAFGVRIAIPPIRFDTPEDVARALRASVTNGFVQAAQRLQEARALRLAAASDPRKLLDAARVVFGKAFVLAPRFAPPGAAELRADLEGTDLLRHAGPFAMDGWLHGAASVRESLGCLHQVWALAEAFGYAPPDAKPAQMPRAAGDPWLGAAYPADYEPSGDKLSLVVLGPSGWDLHAGAVTALLVDQWTETIPSRSETTGVTFHYEQPDATPPQALLLAVPPKLRGTWRWEDLVHTLHDTLELARNRVVELEHLSGEVYSQLLPALLGELVPERLAETEQEVTGSRVILDFGINNRSA